MATYREQEEIELNVLQACSGRAMLISHVANTCRINMVYARAYVTRLLEQGMLVQEGRSFRTSPKGFQRMHECEERSMIYSLNYKKIVERLAVA